MTHKTEHIPIYHVVHPYEDLEIAANQLFSLVQKVAQMSPGAPRHLFLDIEDHRNKAGGFDADMLELQNEFLIGVLMKYLTEAVTPLGYFRNRKEQDDDVPEVLDIFESAADN